MVTVTMESISDDNEAETKVKSVISSIDDSEIHKIVRSGLQITKIPLVPFCRSSSLFADISEKKNQICKCNLILTVNKFKIKTILLHRIRRTVRRIVYFSLKIHLPIMNRMLWHWWRFLFYKIK